MAEPDDSHTNKRKASPGPDAEDIAVKRTKVQEGDDAPSSDNSNNNVEKALDETGNGVAQHKEEQGKSHVQRSPRPHLTEAEPELRHSSDTRRPSATAGPPPRRSFSLEEKKRGQRLFGGLVSALSRTPSGSQQQKRLEIERRQQEKAQQRRAEDEKRRAEKLGKLERIRRIEQVKLEEQAMRTRHSTLLALARSLQTRSEPKIYYLPWKLTKEQEEIIEDQVRAAEETIERELRDFEARKERRLKELGVSVPPPPPQEQQQQQKQEPEIRTEEGPLPEEKATIGEPKPPPQDGSPGVVTSPPSKVRNDHHHDKDHDENGDEMMQDEEDTVIY
ncbi:hypothetical protein VTK26DRAFT_8907 [Humicola hyalothermophila]